MKKGEKGYSLTEVLVGISMAAVIFLAVISLMTAMMGSTNKSRFAQTMKQTKNDLLIDMTNNLKWATKVCPSVSSIDINEGAVVYSYSGGRIKKNGDPITSKSIDIRDFQIKTLEDGSLMIEINEMVHIQNEDLKDTMRLVISPRNKSDDECI